MRSWSYVALSLLALAGDVHAQPARPPALELRNLAPGALEIVNTSAAPVDVRWELVVERRISGAWRRAGLGLRVVDSCSGRARGACRQLAPGAGVRPVPWSGFSCGGQCPHVCRRNGLMVGTYRFVIVGCDGSRYEGAPFEITPAHRRASR